MPMNREPPESPGQGKSTPPGGDLRAPLLAAVPLVLLLLHLLADHHRSLVSDNAVTPSAWNDDLLQFDGRSGSQEQSLRAVFQLAGIPVNTAGEELLTTIPGIGPVLAERIVARRNLSGPYRAPSDLMDVAGIGPRRAEQIAPHLSFD